MRVFVLTKKNIIFYCVMLMAALSIFITRWDSSVYVFNNNAELNSLPIYCVDKGDEKICAISFDAAWGNEDTEELINILGKYKINYLERLEEEARVKSIIGEKRPCSCYHIK